MYKHSANHPINIQADKMVVKPQKQYVEFQGNVRVKQDEMLLIADTLLVHMNSSKKGSSITRESVEKINANGNVNITWNNYRVEADTAVYVAPENKLVISGDKATLYQGKNTIAGAIITLYMNTDQIEIESKKGEQIEAIYEFTDNEIQSLKKTGKKQ